MTAIVLAAGVGKRLHAASRGKPKCLIEIGGRSLLAGRESTVRRVILASATDGTYIPRETPRPSTR